MRGIAYLLGPALALLVTPAAAQPRWPAWLKQARSPIVRVVARQCIRLQQEPDVPATPLGRMPVTVNRVGTGFLYRVGTQTRVITARHVVMGCTGGVALAPLKGQDVNRDEGEQRSAELIGCNAAGDFAVLKVPSGDWPKPLTKAPPGGSLEMIGIPWGTWYSQATVVTEGPLGRLDTLVSGSLLPAFQALGSPRADTNLYRLGGTARAGESGGPLLTWRGQEPFVAGVTIAQHQDLTFYLPMDFVDAEIDRVEVGECAIPEPVARSLPLASETLPHVGEVRDEACKLGVATLQRRDLTESGLRRMFGTVLDAFDAIRDKLGPNLPEQRFSHLKLGELDLIVPEGTSGLALQALFNDGCSTMFQPLPLDRPRSYVAELVVAPPDTTVEPKDLFKLALWTPTKPLWLQAPQSFTRDQLAIVEGDDPTFTETLAFVTRQSTPTAKLYYLAKWEPERLWKRACLSTNLLRTAEEQRTCDRERLNFVAFAEAVQLVAAQSARASSPLPLPPSQPLNQLVSGTTNQLR